MVCLNYAVCLGSHTRLTIQRTAKIYTSCYNLIPGSWLWCSCGSHTEREEKHNQWRNPSCSPDTLTFNSRKSLMGKKLRTVEVIGAIYSQVQSTFWAVEGQRKLSKCLALHKKSACCEENRHDRKSISKLMRGLLHKTCLRCQYVDKVESTKKLEPMVGGRG